VRIEAGVQRPLLLVHQADEIRRVHAGQCLEVVEDVLDALVGEVPGVQAGGRLFEGHRARCSVSVGGSGLTSDLRNDSLVSQVL